MTGDWIPYDYALIQLVPCVHRRTSFTVGVVLHAPTQRFLAAKFLGDLSKLSPHVGDVDLDLVSRYLASLAAVASGSGGPLASMSASERFHWLTAPRSDVLQPTRPHSGRALDPSTALDEIFRRAVQ